MVTKVEGLEITGRMVSANRPFPLLALKRRWWTSAACLLSGKKRTSDGPAATSLFDPETEFIPHSPKVVGHARYVSVQMAEVAIRRNVFADILRMIAELRLSPITSTA
jgi:hypothetical protein